MDKNQLSQFRSLLKEYTDLHPEVQKRLSKMEAEYSRLPFASFEIFLYTMHRILALPQCRESEKELAEKYQMAVSINRLIYRERAAERVDCDSVYKATLQCLCENTRNFQPNHRFSAIYKCEHIVAGIYNTYRNKNLYLQMLAMLTTLEQEEMAYAVIGYLNRVRQYYIDERASFSSGLDLIHRLSTEASTHEAEKIIALKVLEDKKNAGIYEVNRADFEELDALCKKTGEGLDQVSARLDTIDTAVQGYTQNLAEQFNTHNTALRETYTGALRELVMRKEAIVEELDSRFTEFKREVNRIVAETELQGDGWGTRAPVPFVMKAEAGNYEHPPNPLFENALSYQEKLALFQQNKAAHELYHEKFDTAAKILLMQNPARAVLLVGPSGAGKTHTVEQLSKALNLKLYAMGYVNEEYKLIGFKDANSNYDITPFYAAFKYGGLCFFDEMDNSHPGALMLLHEFMGTSNGASYLFPNKEEVQAHPYFRLVAAANTWGDGANRTYNVRAKLDGATENRFKAIKYDYDPKVEMKLTQDSDLLSFLRQYRKILEENDYPQPLTYRDIMDMDMFIRNGVFTIEEAMEINLIKGASADKLKKISGSLKNSGLDRGNKYLLAFHNLVEHTR